MTVTRRRFVRVALWGGIPLAGLGGLMLWADRKLNPHTSINYPWPQTRSGLLMPTPACADADDSPTHAVTEGPFYTPNTPQRSVLREAATAGVPLTFRGRVLAENCQPIAGAVVDVWSCDGRGVYDNKGFRLRGHQFTDAAGRFEFETVRPSDYTNFGVHRTAHLHVKVQGRETKLLTTQLFFPGEAHNAKDWFFRDDLLLTLQQPAPASLLATFDFVLQRGA